jgi:hypothetical protein
MNFFDSRSDVALGSNMRCAEWDEGYRHGDTSPAGPRPPSRLKRRAFKKDVRVSKALGISTEQVLERREQAVVDWMSWLTEKMSEQKADDPQASAGITALN